MATPNSRITLIQWCLRSLGKDVVEINMSDSQIDDRVDEALDVFTQYHVDGVLKRYTAHQLTANDVTNNYVTMPNTCIAVTRIFPLTTTTINSNQTTGGFNMFDINYQVRLNEIYDMTSADYVYFELANQHLATLEMLFTGQVPIRYNRYENILYMDLNWGGPVGNSAGGDVVAGNYVIIECYVLLDPLNNSLFWNDWWLKMYTKALLKRQWAENLKKFGGVKLPGGVILNGIEMYTEASVEVKDLEIKIRDTFESPPEFFTG